jgi:hypothetical protein
MTLTNIKDIFSQQAQGNFSKNIYVFIYLFKASLASFTFTFTRCNIPIIVFLLLLLVTRTIDALKYGSPSYQPVLRILDVYTSPIFSIPDPGSRVDKKPDPGSRVGKIPGPGSASKNLSIFNPKH